MKKQTRKNEILYIIEAAFEYFITLFVTGTMLGYILDTLGFSDAMQGIVSTVATFTCGAQLFALLLAGRKRKRIVVIGNLFNQTCFALLYLLPVFSLVPMVKTALLMVLLFAGHIVSNAMTPSRITWLMSAVPNDRRGRFTATKEMLSLAGGIVVSLAFGAVADVFRDASGMPTRPYYVICAAALIVMMLIHTACLLLSSEQSDPSEVRIPLRNTVSKMLRSKKLLRVIGVGVFWNIASALSVSFYASYVREELGFRFTTIALIATAGSVCRILLSPLIGRIADKYSFATSATLSFGIAAAAFFAMSLATPETRWLYLVYTCLHSFAMAGISSGGINLIYDYVDPAERAAALGLKNAVGGALAFFTALLSGVLLDKIQANGGFSFLGKSLYAQQVLAALSFAAVILLIVYMRVAVAPMRRTEEKEG